MIPIFLRNNQNSTTFVLDPARNCCKGVGCGWAFCYNSITN